MKKKVLAALLVGMMSVSLLAGCSTGMENDASSSAPSGAAVNSESNVSSGSGSEGSGESTGTGEKLENVVLCLSNASDNLSLIHILCYNFFGRQAVKST